MNTGSILHHDYLTHSQNVRYYYSLENNYAYVSEDNAQKLEKWQFKKDVCFAVDSLDNYVHHSSQIDFMRFYTEVDYSKINVNIENREEPSVYINDAFLLFQWMGHDDVNKFSFGHILPDAFPRLLIYKSLYEKNRNVKLLVPQILNIPIINQIFRSFNIEIDNIVHLRPGNVYLLENLFTAKLCKLWDTPNEPIKSSFFLELRDKLGLDRSNKYTKKVVYLARSLKESNHDLRRMLNEDELIQRLIEKYNAIIIYDVKDLTLLERTKCLEDCHTIITTVGSNMMNLWFSMLPKNLVAIQSQHWPQFEDMLIHFSEKEKANRGFKVYRFDKLQFVDSMWLSPGCVTGNYSSNVEKIIELVDSIL